MKTEDVHLMLSKVEKLLPQMSPEGALKVQALLDLAKEALADFESHGIDLEKMGHQEELAVVIQAVNDLYIKYATN